MTASEHLALCEVKRGGATTEERALCAELEAAEAALKRAMERITDLEEQIANARDHFREGNL